MNNISNEQAMDIIRKHQQKPPVDVVAIAHDLNINVYTALGDGLSGMIKKDNEQEKAV